ncbi:RagB/SusD family nutrient uptake outer membrane protein [Chitinophaga filiformis]|uniref:SusD family protein n=1 Tax=Chitinophaga filiformis TaxID=104663 RepID=A0A1G7R2L7_CHIFI|nr:RagB/SusD family nutrient uptake outer membrane protein [Chitinophaga filiformis]SDG04977.1 SusD family protein [Chitinophaga filiformis]
MQIVYKTRYIIHLVFLLLTGYLWSGCKKLIEVDLPIDKATSEIVFSNTSTAVAAMTGIYARMGAADDVFTDVYGLSIRTGLRADELIPTNPAAYPDYTNTVTGSNNAWTMWEATYRDHIYRVNSLLEGVKKSATLPEDTKLILTGEAKFTRAWLYFYLVNLYGDVPLVLTTDFKANSTIPRTDKQLVYEQIVKDLKDAQEGLKTEFLDRDLVSSTQERIRPNKAAATALLARVYLYMGKWQEAETEAGKVINDADYELLADVNQVFLKNSKEAIWQLQPNPLDQQGANAPDGRSLINPSQRNPFFYVSSSILNAFEPDDIRKTSWITKSPSGLIIPYKYKEGWAVMEQKEYTMVLRLAEQYLIRAEARTHLNNLTGDNSATSDLNAIRSRAGLPGTSAVSQEDLLAAIAKERQTELFMEWGDRWFDLQRRGQLNAVMSVVAQQKGTTWAPYKALLPIPYDEFRYNPALRGHQNPGYLEQP